MYRQLEMEITDSITQPHPYQLTPETMEDFLFAGKAKITLINTNTGNRYTYRIKKLDDKNLWFVSLLTGSDNETDYEFFGTIFDYDKFSVRHSKKSRLTVESTGVKVFNWFLKHRNNLPSNVEVWHNGYCAKCGRMLTVPSSIQAGFGPKCLTTLEY